MPGRSLRFLAVMITCFAASLADGSRAQRGNVEREWQWASRRAAADSILASAPERERAIRVGATPLERASGAKTDRWPAIDRQKEGAARALFAARRQRPVAKRGFPHIVPAEQVRSFPLLARYAAARVVRIDLLGSRREQTLEQLSLADYNRFQFRRNRSVEPGVPVASPADERVDGPNR